MVIYQKLLPRTKKRGVFYLSLKISSLNRLASYDEYPPGESLTNTNTPRGFVFFFFFLGFEANEAIYLLPRELFWDGGSLNGEDWDTDDELTEGEWSDAAPAADPSAPAAGATHAAAVRA